MIVFEVWINKELHRTAGIAGRGALTAILCSTGVGEGETEAPDEAEDCGISLEVGALESQGDGTKRSINYATRRLNVGDEVLIRIVSAATCDLPDKVVTVDPGDTLRRKEAYFERLKAELGKT